MEHDGCSPAHAPWSNQNTIVRYGEQQRIPRYASPRPVVPSMGAPIVPDFTEYGKQLERAVRAANNQPVSGGIDSLKSQSNSTSSRAGSTHSVDHLITGGIRACEVASPGIRAVVPGLPA
jgi:hypothetical protein